MGWWQKTQAKEKRQGEGDEGEQTRNKDHQKRSDEEMKQQGNV